MQFYEPTALLLKAFMSDLLSLTAELVDIPSVSSDEKAIADYIESELRQISGLQVERIGDNLVARTNLGHAQRILLAGHTDTVPGTQGSRIDGDTLWGLGSADMKSGLAVMLELARTITEPKIDVTWVFYVCEEVQSDLNGLRHLFVEAENLLEADAAVLGEPTNGMIEAGCQGTMRFEVSLRGTRAHTARPWMGVNAIHRAGSLLSAIDQYQHREPEIDGCKYREALQVVNISGGIAGNVVPDETVLLINHRYAPDRNGEEAESHVKEFLTPYLREGDLITLIDHAPAAAPGLNHPLISSLIESNELTVKAKLGWTDVAFFAERGIPAVNFGPGDPILAHTENENVQRTPLEETFAALVDLLT